MIKVALDQKGTESSLSDQVGQARNKNAYSRKQQDPGSVSKQKAIPQWESSPGPLSPALCTEELGMRVLTATALQDPSVRQRSLS